MQFISRTIVGGFLWLFFSTTLFASGSLWDSDWRSLAKRLVLASQFWLIWYTSPRRTTRGWLSTRIRGRSPTNS